MINFSNAVQIGEISWVGNSVVGLSFGWVFRFSIVVWVGAWGVRLNKSWQGNYAKPKKMATVFTCDSGGFWCRATRSLYNP